MKFHLLMDTDQCFHAEKRISLKFVSIRYSAAEPHSVCLGFSNLNKDKEQTLLSLKLLSAI